MEDTVGLSEAEGLRQRLRYLAWRWYRIPQDVAEDVVQSALTSFVQVHRRYGKAEEHPKILVGIFRNKCREHIDQAVRAERRLNVLRRSLLEGRVRLPSGARTTTPEAGVLGDLVNREEGRLILQALAELRPNAREMFRLIVDEGASRQDLIDRYGLNKNTLDSRLHSYRREFRAQLARRGIEF